MKKLIFLFFLFLSFSFSNTIAQTSFGVPIRVDLYGNILNLNEAIQVRVVDEIPLYKAELTGLSTSVSAEKIKGSPFWNNDWKWAQLFDRRNNSVGFINAKMNLNNSSVHFLNNQGKEVCLSVSDLNRVIFYKDSVSKEIGAVFVNSQEYKILQNEFRNYFLQIIYEGSETILEAHKKEVENNQIRKYNDLPYSFKSKRKFLFLNQNSYRSTMRLTINDLYSVLHSDIHRNQIISSEKGLKNQEFLIKELIYLNFNKD